MNDEELMTQRTKKTTPEHLDLRSGDIRDEKKAELLRLFPEVRTEGGKLDFDRLKLALGESVDVGKERYGMTWPGKADCFKTIQRPSMGTLRPAPKESVNFDTSENLIIEGDNLEVLKLLQKSYLGKVKMIYIDPPYNTGNDFIYPDDFSESLQTYLEYTGQADEDGTKFSTNTETNGRFHSKWLNMMYPRLYLARNLLRQDGVVFISIDDHEMDNLRRLCNDVFGEENFVALLAVQLNPRGRHLDNFVARTHEYVLVFGRNVESSGTIQGVEKTGRMVEEYDKDDERGRYREIGLRNRNQAFNRKTRPNLFYALYVDPSTGQVAVHATKVYTDEVLPTTSEGVETCWTWSTDKVSAENHMLVARKAEDGAWRIFRKDYLVGEDGDTATTLTKSLWTDKDINNDYGKRAMRELFGEPLMDFPKSPALIKKLVVLGSGEGDVCLDFFAGSGTTGQAVLEANRDDGRQRKFILVQLPEPTGRKDFPTIAEITKERVRRVIKKLDEDGAEQLKLGGQSKEDHGFRVFSLAESNFRPWDSDVSHDPEALKKQLALHVDHVRKGRTPEDLLVEILLKSGFPLTTPVEKLTLAGKIVHSVADGALLVCLDDNLTLELIRAVADRKPERVVCLDQGFAGADQLKTNAVQIFKTKGVTSFKTV